MEIGKRILQNKFLIGNLIRWNENEWLFDIFSIRVREININIVWLIVENQFTETKNNILSIKKQI